MSVLKIPQNFELSLTDNVYSNRKHQKIHRLKSYAKLRKDKKDDMINVFSRSKKKKNHPQISVLTIPETESDNGEGLSYTVTSGILPRYLP